MEAVTLSEARVYVGTYARYNNGSLFGKWLDLSDYSDKDEFLEACRELHKDDYGRRREKESDTQHRQDHRGNRQQDGTNIK